MWREDFPSWRLALQRNRMSSSFLVNEALDDDPGLLVELASFLLDRHLFQQRVSATSDFGVGEGLCLCVESGCGNDERKRGRSGDSEESGFHRLMADKMPTATDSMPECMITTVADVSRRYGVGELGSWKSIFVRFSAHPTSTITARFRSRTPG